MEIAINFECIVDHYYFLVIILFCVPTISINNTNKQILFDSIDYIIFHLYFFISKKVNWKKNRKIYIKIYKQTYRLTVVYHRSARVVGIIGYSQDRMLMNRSLNRNWRSSRKSTLWRVAINYVCNVNGNLRLTNSINIFGVDDYGWYRDTHIVR